MEPETPAGGTSVPSPGDQERERGRTQPAQFPKAPTTFREFYDLGYKTLIPVVPPGAAISKRSILTEKSRGKSPGVKWPDGVWSGMPQWQEHVATEDDLDTYQDWGANTGFRLGEGVAAIDADILDVESANKFAEIVERHIGVCVPVRIGQRPKHAYLVRVSEPIPYMCVAFEGHGKNGRHQNRVEILAEGRQIVVSGLHAATGKPYEWPRGLCPRDQLTSVTLDALRAIMEETHRTMPAATVTTSKGPVERKAVDQETLRGDLEMVRKIAPLIPNDERFTREDYIKVLCAFKAALHDHPDEAFDLALAWCEPWPGGNDPNTVKADWDSLKPPFRLGAGYLYELAEKYSPEKFSRAEIYFNVIEAPDLSPFDIAAERERISNPEPQRKKFTATPYMFPNPASIKPRQWVYGSHYMRGILSVTVAPGGVGKSSLKIVEALAMASGKPLLGVEPKGAFRVLLWNGEDPRDELDRRIGAALRYYGLTPEDFGDRLFVDTGFEQGITLAKMTRDGAVIAKPMVAEIFSEIRSRAIDVILLDPFISTHGVPENDNNAIDVVAKEWARIAAEGNVSVALDHHVRKTNGTEITIEDARGAISLINAARDVRTLNRMTSKQGLALGVADYQRYFRFGDITKSNLTPASALSDGRWFALQSEPLGNGAGDGIEAFMTGDQVGVVTKVEVADMAEPENLDRKAEALRLIEDGEWQANVQAKNAWVGHLVAQAYGLDAGDAGDRTQINGLLRRWHAEGSIRYEMKKNENRKPRRYVRVLKSAPVARAEVENVFD